MKVALDANAVRRCARVEKLADAGHVVVLLEAGIEGAVLVDPEGPVGEPAGGADHLGIEPGPEHVANRLRRVGPAHGMVQHVEVVDERTGFFCEQPHVSEQPVAERGVGRPVPGGERAPDARHHVVASDRDVPLAAPLRCSRRPFPAEMVITATE